MIFREFLTIAAGNLWRLKLRTSLTVSGIVIGIGALVAMLSFAFGLEKNASEQFRSLGLFQTLRVMPGMTDRADSTRAAPDSAAATPRALDDEALELIAALDGVTLVYPQVTFDARLEWGERSASVSAQALPAAFATARRFGRLTAGSFYAADSLPQVVLGQRLLDRMEIEADSILGDTITIKVAGRGDLARQFVRQVEHRLQVPGRLREMVEESMDALRFLFGPDEARIAVCGIAELEGGFGFRMHDLLMPTGVAQGLDRLSFSDPLELLAELNTGSEEGYAIAVVTHEEGADHEALRDQIERLGLRTFSFVDQFDEMRRGFLFMDMIVGVVGVIALFVAALGIVNTMIMSITERIREIGILRSLGAEGAHIRWMFLVESGLIGLFGSVGGLVLGYIISRVASIVVKRILIAQDAPAMDLFHMPIYVVPGAIAFGLAVSLLAGLYPATRAARVDPVQALRHD